MKNTALSWLACPVCRGALLEQETALFCPRDNVIYPIEDGIIRLLPEGQRAAAGIFAAEYQARREAQGWRRLEAWEMSALPAVSPAGWDKIYWPARWQSYQAFSRWLAEFEASQPGGLRVVDMGAGVGWLAARLVEKGRQVLAIDLSCDDSFGLGAARRLRQEREAEFVLVQADIEAPPVQPGSVDLLVYNASLHYAGDIAGCLAAGATTLRQGGAMVIMDSPISTGPVTAVPQPPPGIDAPAPEVGESQRGRHLPNQEVFQALSAAGLVYDIIAVRRGLRWQLRQFRTRLFGVAVFDLPLIVARPV